MGVDSGGSKKKYKKVRNRKFQVIQEDGRKSGEGTKPNYQFDSSCAHTQRHAWHGEGGEGGQRPGTGGHCFPLSPRRSLR